MLKDPELSVEEMVRCARDLHIPAVEIGSHVNSLNLSDKKLEPIFAVRFPIKLIFSNKFEIQNDPEIFSFDTDW